MSRPSAPWLHSPLAIIGMSCRLPGADGLEQFWDLLSQGGYAVERMPDSKLDRRLYFDPQKGHRCKTYSQIGGFVRERELDWSLLNIRPKDASDWDQCHLSLCEVVAKACQNAGYDPKNLPNRNVGVFVGHSGGTTLGGDLAYRKLADQYVQLLNELPDWQSIGSNEALQQLHKMLTQCRPERQADGKPYVDAGFASGIISHNFGLTGPHMSIDAACASSLVALALGSMSLACGQADMAIVGGASYNKADSLVLFSAAQSCSSQASRPFDQNADGLISSEGYVAILIKPLHKAQQDGDRIQAVIRGIGYSSDGRGRSLWAPRHEGQSTAIQRAYPSEIDPSSVQLIEAHATSTQVGDATEMEALTKFYAPRLRPGQRIPVGSVKSNLGHTLETSGLAGLVKSVLAIQRGIIPPSINLENPNQSIPWQSIPFYVPKSAQPWPEQGFGIPRRVAVNAFGIGGLNVHVVVDQALPSAFRANVNANGSHPSSTLAPQPIAVIGRGLVVPGANNLSEYQIAITTSTGNTANSDSELTHRVQFEYDWRKHKIPPKQIDQANPLQFMLLDAAEQALNEAGLLQSSTFDRATSAVVVGSIFGGDFGNELFAGLRLPEFRDRLCQVLESRGIDASSAFNVCEKFEQKFLQRYPALLDETGSFTSSTLASRIAKTFNLMGGAMALDSGDCSGLAALRSACWLLQSGSVSSVLCAAAQRALDQAALENLLLCSRLKRLTANSPNDQGYTVGEGVVVLALKRLADAERDGNKVLAVIDQVNLAYDASSLERSVELAASSCKFAQSAENATTVIGQLGIERLDRQVANSIQRSSGAPIRFTPPINLHRTGHLQGVQGLLDVLNCSLNASNRKQWIVAHSLSGQTAIAELTIPSAIEPKPAPSVLSFTRLPQNNTHAIETDLNTPLKARNTSIEKSNADAAFVSAGLETLYWSAGTLDQLSSIVKESTWSPTNSLPQAGRFVATVVAPIGQAKEKARKLAGLIGPFQALDQLIDQGLWWHDRHQEQSKPIRIGFAFSGQGSQYGGMLAGVAKHFPQAQRVLASADQILQRIDGSTFAEIAWAPENQLGENVWQTQAALLIADTMLANVVRSLELTPALVFGHSYGEIPAMLHVGSIDFESAMHLTWHRCRCVLDNAPSGCSMLSVQANANTVAEAIAESHLPLTISHVNSPLQTVVGGKHSHIAQLAARLDDVGIATRILPVPTAFHTPTLQAAVAPFRQALNQIAIEPPRIPLLSSVNNRFMAEPEWIREGLAEQLVTPLRFVELLQRVSSSGITHLIEIGPQRVLTRLARACETGMQIFASDYGSQGQGKPSALMPLGLIAAFAKMTSASRNNEAESGPLRFSTSRSISDADANSSNYGVTRIVEPSEIKSFDATAVRRARMRSVGTMPFNRPFNPQANTVSSAVGNTSASEELSSATPIQQPVSAQASSKPQQAETFVATSNANSKPATSPAVSTLHATKSAAPSVEQVQQILIDFVVEQTGYPAEIVELDADLEADLGIDSIKKAQLMGELRELFPQALSAMQSKEGRGDARAQGNRLAQLRTLNDFVQLIQASAESNQASDATEYRISEVALTSQVEVVQSSSPQPATSSSLPATALQASNRSIPRAQNTSGLTRQKLEQFVIDFVVEQTGYPPELVELNADLEADLGIDSIKKAQLLGELRETFAIQFSQTENTPGNSSRTKKNLDHLRTLNQILDELSSRLGMETGEITERSADGHSPSSDPFLTKGDEGSIATPSIKEVAEYQPTSSPTSSRLVSMPLPPSSSRGSAASFLIPVYDAKHRNGFCHAVRHNLRALPGRRCNGSDEITCDHQRFDLARELAAHVELPTESLLTFDQQIASDSSWTILESQPSVDSTSSVHYLLELELPAWLCDGKCYPLGIRRDLGGVVQLLTPGAITASVAIDSANTLIAVDASTPESKYELTQLIHSLIGLETVQIESQLCKQKLSGDWMILVTDVTRKSVHQWQMVNQVLSHSSCDLRCWPKNEAISEGKSCRIGFDTILQSWVIVSRDNALAIPSRISIAEAILQSQEIAGNAFPSTEMTSTCQVVLDSTHESSSEVTTIEETNFFAAFTISSIEEPTQEFSQGSTFNHSHTLLESLAIQERPEWLGRSDDRPIEHSSDIAQRYVLRLAPAPQLAALDRQPTWSGAAIVVGHNPIADEIEARLRKTGVEVVRLIADGSCDTQLADQFSDLAKNTRLAHLFITTPCDADAQLTLDPSIWLRRRSVGLMNNFWLCQRWLDHITSLNMTDDASLIAVSSMGGDFGISGNIHSAEGGGINGLLKSMLIESWMQGYRSLPIKTIDTHPRQNPVDVVNDIWRELATPSYDNEITYVSGSRQILKAIPRSNRHSTLSHTNAASQPIDSKALRPITRGGNWVMTGGARGITAFVAERLATRYGLTVHLIGTAQSPDIDPAWRELDTEGLRQLKLHVMTEARSIGKNPVKHWQDTEKQMEIDATLRRLRDQGVRAYYHSCDVADRRQLLDTLQTIRETSGPIHGVVHGAGIGRDARFDRKQPEKVNQCIAAKVDGALSLMHATWQDPLEVFIGFGSISGRFGANGHTDYSQANEMLCKQIDWLKSRRPEVRAIGFHWHAWGDVGMATKPETKLALEMIHMQFMPADEGVQHLIRELETNQSESEVLITDDRYYRAFYPAETLVEASSSDEGSIETPLLCLTNLPQHNQTAKTWLASVNPTKDPFLAEHLLDGAPLLPFVVATEMLREAAAAHLNSNSILLSDITAHGAVRFFTEAEQDLTLIATGDGNRSQIELRSDFVSRKGIIVDRNRLNFSAQARLQTATQSAHGRVRLSIPESVQWQPVEYPPADAEFYVGWPLQKLRKVAHTSEGLLGRISAPALIELAGVTRSTRGWIVPSAALDACLFAVGILAWQRIAPGSALPVRMSELRLGRLPRPGESLMVHVTMREASQGKASFDFSLYGVDGSMIVDVVNYEVAWLQRTAHELNSSIESQQG